MTTKPAETSASDREQPLVITPLGAAKLVGTNIHPREIEIIAEAICRVVVPFVELASVDVREYDQFKYEIDFTFEDSYLPGDEEPQRLFDYWQEVVDAINAEDDLITVMCVTVAVKKVVHSRAWS